MKTTIEIISIGNELLSGKTVNSNGAFLGRCLTEHGYQVEKITTLPDDLFVLQGELKKAVDRAALVLVTGGLGPTEDDTTRMAIATAFDRALKTDRQMAAGLARRFAKKKAALRYQADIPQGATVLINELGTATGFALELSNSFIIALPGVPQEMERMVTNQGLELIKKRLKKTQVTAALYFCLRSESQFDQVLGQVVDKDPFLRVGICPSYEGVAIYLRALIGEGNKEKPALARLTKACEVIQSAFPTYCFSTDLPGIEWALSEALRKEGKTVAVAESCTGGKVAAALTRLSGASKIFCGGFVVYANELKQKLLGVPQKTLDEQGAVSFATIFAMIQGVFARTNASYALATSGVAGPDGGTKDKPVGTVWVALGDRKKDVIYTHCLNLNPKMGRSVIIDYVTHYLLASFWRYLTHKALPFKEGS